MLPQVLGEVATPTAWSVRPRPTWKAYPTKMSSDENTTEMWRPIPGYFGYYEASNLGRVRSLDRWIRASNGRRRFCPGQIMKQDTCQCYPKVGLSANGSNKKWLVHRLILLAFVGECPVGMLCCHADDVATNNVLSNLRWDYPRANMLDSVRNGRHRNARKVACIRGHGFDETNTYVNLTSGKRRCRECARINYRRSRAA